VVVECLPNGVAVVDGDGVADIHRLDRGPHAVDALLELELRRLYADHGQPLIGVPVSPGPYVGQRTDPVDAGVGSEADEDDPPQQGVGVQGFRIKPGGCPVEGRSRSFDRELVAMTKHRSSRQCRDGDAARRPEQHRCSSVVAMATSLGVFVWRDHRASPRGFSPMLAIEGWIRRRPRPSLLEY
jgi:hypothetical protein